MAGIEQSTKSSCSLAGDAANSPTRSFSRFLSAGSPARRRQSHCACTPIFSLFLSLSPPLNRSWQMGTLTIPRVRGGLKRRVWCSATESIV